MKCSGSLPDECKFSIHELKEANDANTHSVHSMYSTNLKKNTSAFVHTGVSPYLFVKQMPVFRLNYL